MKNNIFSRIKIMMLAVLVCATSTLCHAFGERGCTVIPENKKGACEKNTEGTYDCIPDRTVWHDCTSS